jgi:hypothetical protein
MKIKLQAAEYHCTQNECDFSMTASVGARLSIAGYPHIMATVKSVEHGERIVNAHSFMHHREHHSVQYGLARKEIARKQQMLSNAAGASSNLPKPVIQRAPR